MRLLQRTVRNTFAVWGLKIEYAGNAILLTGDSDRENWENRIVPHYSDDKEENGKKLDNLLNARVLHASHHGS